MTLFKVFNILFLLTAFQACEKNTQKDMGDKFTTTLVPHRFEQFDFGILWVRNKSADIALGINVGDFKDSNFGTRIHDYNTAPKEFSCFPDDVIITKTQSGSSETAYAGYLRWQNSVSVDSDMAESSYHRKFGDGMLTRYIEQDILSGMQEIKADVSVKHTLMAEANFVKTTVTLKSLYEETAEFKWIYQDAAFLYLPNENQTQVTPVGSNFDGIYRADSAKAVRWVGLVDYQNKIASISYSPVATAYFVLPRYLGVRNISVKDCRSIGVECTLGGNDRFLADKIELDGDEGIKNLVLQEKVLPEQLKNQAMLFTLKLSPNETGSFNFYRFTVSGFNGYDDLDGRVKSFIEGLR